MSDSYGAQVCQLIERSSAVRVLSVMRYIGEFGSVKWGEEDADEGIRSVLRYGQCFARASITVTVCFRED
jgi:hypothetical protein